MTLLATICCKVNAQSTDQVTHNVTFEEKKLEALVICMDAIEVPTKYNEFATQFINSPSFPKKETSESQNEYKAKIDQWLKDNPTIVDEIMTERKKAHDKLYGPRPY